MIRTAIVLGTGLSDLDPSLERVTIETPGGDVDVALDPSHDLLFLPRHGTARRPAHAIDHRANVDALARSKVARVLAINTVGALDAPLRPGSFVVPHDLLDLGGHHASFHDDAPVHVDVTEPYCPELRAALAAAARADGAPIVEHGTYAATRGPRLETPAEVRALRQLGGTVVGMTGGAEATLARERALCYASLCLVTNPAAGVTSAPVRADEIKAGAAAMAERALAIARRAAASLPPERGAGCRCKSALDGARL